jgi:formylglycine-generating enzyme required for sulfatase activity
MVPANSILILDKSHPVESASPILFLHWLTLPLGMASHNATASNPDEPSAGQARRTAPPGMVWIPGGTFLMGTDGVVVSPTNDPPHRVHVEGFWIDDHG